MAAGRIFTRLVVFAVSILALLGILLSLLVQQLPRWDADLLPHIEERIGGKIEYKRFYGSRSGYDVELAFDDARLLFPGRRPQEFREVRVRIDTWRTLLGREPVVDKVHLVGAHWDVVVNERGELSIPALDGQGAAMANWNTAPFQLVMSDATVTWHTPRQTYRFHQVTLALESDGQRVRGLYEMPLPDDGRLRGVASVHGPLLRPKDWVGRVHIAASDMDLQPWEHLLPFVHEPNGRLSAVLDLNWDQGRFREIAGNVTVREYIRGDESLDMEGSVHWQQNDGDDGFIRLDRFDLASGSFNWKGARLDLWFDPSDSVLFSLSMPAEGAVQLGEISLSGAEMGVDVQGRVVRPSDVQNMDWRDMRDLHARFNGRGIRLGYAGHDYQWDELRAGITADADESGYSLRVSDLEANRADSAYRGEAVFVNEKDAGVASVALFIEEMPVTLLGEQLRPLNAAMAKELEPYKGGTLRRTRIMWISPRPPREEVPSYLSASGVMEDADLDLDASDDASELTRLDADFILENDDLSANIHRARLHELDVRSARYTAVGGARPQLVMTLTGALRDFARHFARGDIDRDVTFDGTGEARIAAEMSPQGDLSVISGDLIVDGAAITVATPALAFTNVEGSIALRDDAVGDGTLRAVVDGIPVTGYLGRRGELFLIAVDGTVDLFRFGAKHRLAGNVPLTELREYIHGETKWRGEWYVTERGNVARTRFSSDLRGVVVDLPEPFNKPAGEARPLVFGSRGGEYSVMYGAGDDQIQAYLVDRGTLAGNIHFGPGQFVFSDKGLAISGRPAGTLDVNEWKQLLSTGTFADEFTQTRNMTADVRPQGIVIGGQLVQEPRIRLHVDKTGLVMNLRSEPVSAVLLQQHRRGREEWVLNAEHIHLEGASTGLHVDPGDLPVVRFRVKDMRLGSARMGSVTGTAVPIPDGVSITKARFSLRDGVADLKGTWLYTNEKHDSTFSFEIIHDDYGELLKELRLSNNLKGGRGIARGRLNWPAPPWDIGLNVASGDLKMDLKDGTFRQSKAGIERLVGLFNVTALIRRLNLDFKDVFDEGLSFDRAGGHFLLKNKNIEVLRSQIENPNTRIEITGRANIERRDYDQEMKILIKVHEGLPLVGGLLGGPLAAIGLYVFDKATNIAELVDKVATLRYKISGSWDDPQIEFMEAGGVGPLNLDNMVEPLKKGME